MLYKINTGYGAERYIPIDETELEKAYGLFLMGGRAIFKNGAVDSKVMQDIVPDWHAMMGWVQEHKLGPDDYNELAEKGIDRKARTLQSAAQEKVQYLIAHDQHDLIGKNAHIPELDKPQAERREGTIKSIGEMMS